MNVLLTCYFTSRQDPQHRITRAANDYEYIKPWYDTVLALGLRGIVFHDGLDASFIDQYSTECIRFHRVDLTPYARSSLNDVRFYVYRDFLYSSEANGIERVFMTDVSDVYVVQDPFVADGFDDHHLYFGKDVETVGRNRYVRERFDPHFKTPDDRQLYRHDVLNAGVVGGHCIGVLKFLDRMIETFDALKSLHDNVNMAVLNHTAWTHFADQVCYGAPVTSEFKQYQRDRKDVWFIHK